MEMEDTRDRRRFVSDLPKIGSRIRVYNGQPDNGYSIGVVKGYALDSGILNYRITIYNPSYAMVLVSVLKHRQ